MIVEIVDIEGIAFGETKDHWPVGPDSDYPSGVQLKVEGRGMGPGPLSEQLR